MNIMGSISETEAARFLLRAQFGTSEAEIAAVRAQGYDAWLGARVAPPRGPAGIDWLDAPGDHAVPKEAN